MTHVPFRGAAPMILELEVGRLHFGGDQLSTALERTRAGNLTGLAILSGTRSKAVPNVPTVGEMGFAGLNLRGFNGFVAPIGTPREIVERIQAATAEAARDPQVIERMTKIGAEPWGSTPEEFDGLLKEQLGQMRQIIGKLNIRTTK
jgi:tripartite-type tricarboxylate transporter receptor subunit TctC